jgi:hypothetical protein
MNTRLTTLEQRITDALQPDTAIRLADVAALIEKAEAGIAKAETERAVDQTLSVDPKAARQAMLDADLRPRARARRRPRHGQKKHGPLSVEADLTAPSRLSVNWDLAALTH